MGTIKRWLGLFFSQWSDIKKIRENRKVKESDGTVLILRLDAIGDFILFLDSARAYREIFPNRQLVLLCNKACVPFAEQSGYFDRCITREELPGGLKNCEILIQTVYAKTREIDVIAASIPAVRKISIRPDDSKVNLSRALTIRRIRKACDSIYDELIDTGDERLMELDRNAAFIRGLGKKDFRSNVPELKPLESEALNQDILGLDRSDVSKERASTSPNPYYIVFPGASSRNKMWAAENYAEVIGRIYQETGLECVVCGAPGEEWIFEELLRWLQKKGDGTDTCGRSDRQDLAFGTGRTDPGRGISDRKRYQRDPYRCCSRNEKSVHCGRFCIRAVYSLSDRRKNRPAAACSSPCGDVLSGLRLSSKDSEVSLFGFCETAV